MNAGEDRVPPLAALVAAGEGQVQAERIADFIWMVKDVSNAYLVTTDDGDVLINSGFYLTGERTRRLLDPIRTGPLRAIFLTQAHPDHYGGVPTLNEADTRVIAHRRFTDTQRYFDSLHPFLTARTGKLWAFQRQGRGEPLRPPFIQPDFEVDREWSMEVGGRSFEAISTPGGETLCGLTIWMPAEKVAFTGNLFGPVFCAVPNLVTIRGDRPRLVTAYLESLERVRDLGAELLVTGHGEPIRGAERIRADLDRMRAAMVWLKDQVIAGMNAGRTVHQLMRELTLPDNLALGEFHGKVTWAVRAIWEEHAGWFHYDSTTSLYGVPRSSVERDLVELAGAGQLTARAQAHLDAGRPLEALHLTDIVLDVESRFELALAVRGAALRRLLAASGAVNLSETMWLRNEITLTEQQLSSLAVP